jgi:hypothetical protein
MDEGRKRVLLIAAEKILRRIDSRWPKREYDRSF